MRAILIAFLLLAGCVEPAPEATSQDPPVEMTEVGQPYFINFTGSLSALPTGSSSSSHDFEVPDNTGRITATLLWSEELTQLTFELTPEADGAGHDGGTYDAPGDGRVEADIPEPTTGNWSATVRIAEGLMGDYSLVLFVAPDDAVTTVLEETYVIASGQFFEINTEMPLNGTLNWEWSIEEGTANDFNVHTHFDGQVQYLVEETASSHKGNVTADREGGYSLMWENTGPPQTLVYKAWGDFTVHSYFPPR